MPYLARRAAAASGQRAGGPRWMHCVKTAQHTCLPCLVVQGEAESGGRFTGPSARAARPPTLTRRMQQGGLGPQLSRAGAQAEATILILKYVAGSRGAAQDLPGQDGGDLPGQVGGDLPGQRAGRQWLLVPLLETVTTVLAVCCMQLSASAVQGEVRGGGRVAGASARVAHPSSFRIAGGEKAAVQPLEPVRIQLHREKPKKDTRPLAPSNPARPSITYKCISASRSHRMP